MPSIFEKLNLKDQPEIFVLDAPMSFEPEVTKLHDVKVSRELRADGAVEFALAFAVTQAELDKVSKSLAGRAKSDAIVWIAYPKKSSKRYTCEFNRDSGWHVLRDAGFDTVRSVAIDDDWTGLRFRRVEFIKR
jgi:hypothetical protein